MTGELAGQKRKTCVGKAHLCDIMSFIRLTHHVPSLQLFDALWHVVLDMMVTVWKETDAATYLRATYLRNVPVSGAQKVFKRVTQCTWGRQSVIFGSFWCGVQPLAPAAGRRR